MAHKRIKRITSHAGHVRYLATLSEPIGDIPQDRDITSPYAYSNLHVVYLTEDELPVFIVETSHRQYDIFKLNNGEAVRP